MILFTEIQELGNVVEDIVTYRKKLEVGAFWRFSSVSSAKPFSRTVICLLQILYNPFVIILLLGDSWKS
jgi:hypothetical protein